MGGNTGTTSRPFWGDFLFYKVMIRRILMFKKVEPTMNFVPIEEKTLDFWNKEQIFKKSIENRKNAPNYVFYEGPPTANGLPHAGHTYSSGERFNSTL